jgi:hypothetical protein
MNCCVFLVNVTNASNFFAPSSGLRGDASPMKDVALQLRV